MAKKQLELPAHLPLIEAFGTEIIKATGGMPKIIKPKPARCKGRYTRRLQKQMDEAHALNTLGQLARIAS